MIRRTLEKDQARRYQSAIELAQALAPFANVESRDRAYRLVASTTRAAGTSGVTLVKGAVTTLNTASGETHGQTANQSRSRKLVFAAVGIGATAAIGIVIGLTRGPRGEGRSAKAPVVDHPPNPGAEVARPVKPLSAVVPTKPEMDPETTPNPKAIATPSKATAMPATPKPVQLDEGIELDPTPKKPIKPTIPIKPQTNERDRAKDKIKPTRDSFDPFGSPD